MITGYQLVQTFFDKAQVHKPNMSPHQIHLYVIGLLADELAWAFNNDPIVAKNVKDLLYKLDPTTLPAPTEPIEASQTAAEGTSAPSVGTVKKIEAISNPLGSDISPSLSYQSFLLFLKKFPKAAVKDLRDQTNGFLWVFVPVNAYEDDSQLFKWLRQNKFEWSNAEKAWYYPIL